MKKYDVMKMRPKICELVDLAQRQALDRAEFPYVGPSPPSEVNKSHSDGLASRVIVFVAGGVTRGEISALQAMEKEQNVSELHNFVVGSTEVFTSQQFLKTLSEADSFKGVVDVEQVQIEEERRESSESIHTDQSMEDY